MKAREEEKFLEVEEKKLQGKMAELNRKTRLLHKGPRCLYRD